MEAVKTVSGGAGFGPCGFIVRASGTGVGGSFLTTPLMLWSVCLTPSLSLPCVMLWSVCLSLSLSPCVMLRSVCLA